MKKYISICILLLMLQGCSAFWLKKPANVSNLSGAYTHIHEVQMTELADWGHDTEIAELTLNADSTFHLFIEFAYSDLPGEYIGKWKLNAGEIILTDTTGANNNELRFRANEDGSLTGRYGDSEETFNRNTK
jgi:hypothetical protein